MPCLVEVDDLSWLCEDFLPSTYSWLCLIMAGCISQFVLQCDFISNCVFTLVCV